MIILRFCSVLRGKRAVMVLGVVYCNIMNDVSLVFVVFADKLGLLVRQLTACHMCAHQPRRFVNKQLRIDELMPGVMLQIHLYFLLDTMEQRPWDTDSRVCGQEIPCVTRFRRFVAVSRRAQHRSLAGQILLKYRMFSNLIRTSFCRFLKRKEVSLRF